MLSSEITIKPGKSKVYFRFVLVLYLFTILLLYLSSIYLLIKIVLCCLILLQFRMDYTNQSPCSSIQEIRWNQTEWVLVKKNGAIEHYDEVSVLIHNALFQLIELSRGKTKKIIILFNDQVPKSQLQLIHLKTRAK
ncbi:conserved protein of unknown function [Legionella fallonii LLAP-10]|uniref:Uncharacterized protein n=2 Tax=Legionella fallonii TaxID=96230 RepID=A0A098G6A6_9GAMM|nr:conserved protein of unknown function [Legionella fallonii LLAP-10]